MEKAKPTGGNNTKTRPNGGGTQVLTKNQATQQKQNQNNPKPKQAPKVQKKPKGQGIRLDQEVEDEHSIQNEQNRKWQCPKCKYINSNDDTDCLKCIHLANK